MDKPVKIATHSGFFHADDVFAVAVLTKLFPNFEIVRTRDKETLAQCDFQIDVGGEYSFEQKIFDHHFTNGPCYDDGLLKSSFGLIWTHYGLELCANDEEIFKRVQDHLVRPIDAIDNGVNVFYANKQAPDVCMLSLSSVIAQMNPVNIEDADAVFETQVQWASQVIDNFIAHAKEFFAAREYVKMAYELALKMERRFIELPKAIKWQEHLVTLDEASHILYAVYPHNNQWYSCAVPCKIHSFRCRKNFPSTWAGLRDEEFSRQTGVSDGVFCHHASFICACKSRQSILSLTEYALAN